MRPLAASGRAYDAIADWYEQQFLQRTAPDHAAEGGDPIGIDDALRELLGEPTPTTLSFRARRPA